MPVRKKIRLYGDFRSCLEDVGLAFASLPSFLSTFDCQSHKKIVTTLCEYLSIAEIISLTRTCKRLSGLYQYLLSVQWDVDKALKRYFNDPIGLRSQMAKYDVLITGHFATNYFGRAFGKYQSLRMMIQEGDGPESMIKYLSDVEGYVNVKETRVYKVRCYVTNLHQSPSLIYLRLRLQIMRHTEKKKSFNVFITILPPIEIILYTTNTTAAACVLSWNKAYCVFPLSTFVQHKSYLLHDWNEFTRDTAEYESFRGWNVQEVMWPEEKRHNHPIRERRRIGDRYTWTIPFNTIQVDWLKTPDYVLEYATFKMDTSKSYDDNINYGSGQPEDRNYTIEALELKSRVLKHTYYCGDARMRDFFQSRLHVSTILELKKLAPEQRPANFNDIMRNGGDVYSALEGFDHPAKWVYRDDEFLTWYKAFEKYCPEYFL